MYADELDGALAVRRGDCVRCASHVKGVDAVCELEGVKVGAVFRRVLVHQGAVVAHADQLEFASAPGRGDYGVRAAVCDDGIDVRGRVERSKCPRRVDPARAVRGPRGGDQARGGVVEQHIVRGGQRAGRAWRRERGIHHVARQVLDAARQGARPAVVQVVLVVAGPDGVGEHERVRAVAALVRCIPRLPAHVEGQRGGGAAVRDRLAKDHAHVDTVAGAVRAVRRVYRRPSDDNVL